MDIYTDAVDYDSKKVYQIPALYNTSSSLDFVIQPDKDFILPIDINLNFTVEIDKHYVMDNQADKLFDSVEVIIGNEKVTSRSNANEYFLSSNFRAKANHSEMHFRENLHPAGWYYVADLETSKILSEISASSTNTSNIVRTRTIYAKKDAGDNLLGRVYAFSMQIQSPIFQQLLPLPSNVPIQINFKRARPNIAVLKCDSDATKHYDTNSIELIKPYIEVTAIRSEKLARKYNFETHDILTYPIEQNVIRTHSIDTGINHIDFNATTGGQLPRMIFMGLADPAAFNGDETLSATRFKNNGMSKFELSIDNTVIAGSQVNMSEENKIEAYAKYHRQCKFIPNVYAGKIMDLDNYWDYNCIMAYDLTKIGQKTGWLNVIVDFHENTSSRLKMIVYMVFDKEITIDETRTVTLN